jgi:hypothetical protein
MAPVPNCCPRWPTSCGEPTLSTGGFVTLSAFSRGEWVMIFVAGALILSPLLFKLNLRDEPH